MTVWTDETLAKAERMRAEGLAWDAIGRAFGISGTAVRHKFGRIRRAKEAPKEPVWTDDIVQRAVSLHNDGKSRAEIAAILGPPFNRHMVNGKLTRLGLPWTGGRAHRSIIARPRLVEAPKPRQERRWFPAGPHAVTIDDLTFGACRFPAGDDPPRGEGYRQLFCGEPARLGRPYCAGCCKRAYRADPNPKQNRRAA